VRGDGRVFQYRNADGTLKSARWWIAFFVDGKERRESAGDTEKEAAKLLRKRLGEHAAGTITDPEERRLTVDELLDSYVAELKKQEKKSVPDTESHLTHIRAAFGSRRVLSVTLKDFEKYQADRLAAGRAKQTIDHELGGLRAALRLAKKQGRIRNLAHVPMFGAAAGNVRTGFFEKAELQSLLDQLSERPALADVVRFAFWSAWRKGEVVGLTWDRVDRSAREIRIPTSKNGRPRTLPLDGWLWELIERRWTAREHETESGPALSRFLFHEAGAPFADFRKTWRRACVAAKLGTIDEESGKYTGKLFHDLRRSGIRNMVRAGVPQSVVMAISGHRTISVFLRYDITSTDDQRAALAATQAHLSGEKSQSKVRQIRRKA
jgi:integrase